MPYQTSGARTDPGNKAHFTDFTTATNIENKGGYAGLGLSVSEDKVAVDIDGCVVDGTEMGGGTIAPCRWLYL